MSGQNTCSYQKKYTNVHSKELCEYSCSRTALPDGEYCELHSLEFWKSDPDRVITALKEELKRSLNAAGPIRFIGFHLPDTDLSSQRFDKQVYFQYTVFHGNAIFKNSIFVREASFRECVFERQASFKLVRFSEDADFFGIKAGEILSFSYAEFSTLALLSACAIQNGDFQYAKFSEVLIRESEFKGRTNFDHAYFNGHCDLFRSSFDRVSFHDARFTMASAFHVKFHEKADFDLATFERPEYMRFNTDLTQVSFLRTNLSRVWFGSDTVWDHASDQIPYDVREFKANPGDRRLADVLSVLRDLRDNYEYRLEYEGAGKLFVQEMEIRRQYEDTDGSTKLRPICWRLFSLTGLYRHLCMYGESFRRPALLVLSVFCVSVLFFSVDETYADMGTCQLADSDRLSYALTRTLSGLLQWGCHALPDYLLRALSIPILGMMFVVLRRRFERRFRH